MNQQTRTTQASGTLELRIEELVLHGFSAGDRYAIADGLQVELAKLLTEQNFSLPASVDTRLEFLDAGELRVAPGSRSALLGGQVAQALLGSLRGASEMGPRAGSRSEGFETARPPKRRVELTKDKEAK